MRLETGMLLAEIRRSLEETHPDHAGSMMEDLETLVRTRPTAVLTMGEHPTAEDHAKAERYVTEIEAKGKRAVVLPYGWGFRWERPREGEPEPLRAERLKLRSLIREFEDEADLCKKGNRGIAPNFILKRTAGLWGGT